MGLGGGLTGAKACRQAACGGLGICALCLPACLRVSGGTYFPFLLSVSPAPGCVNWGPWFWQPPLCPLRSSAPTRLQTILHPTTSMIPCSHPPWLPPGVHKTHVLTRAPGWVLCPSSPLLTRHPLVSSLSAQQRSTGLLAAPWTLQAHQPPPPPLPGPLHVLSSAGTAFPSCMATHLPFTKVSAQMSPPRRPLPSHSV